MNNERIAEMETLIRILAKASHAYYVDDEPIMNMTPSLTSSPPLSSLPASPSPPPQRRK